MIVGRRDNGLRPSLSLVGEEVAAGQSEGEHEAPQLSATRLWLRITHVGDCSALATKQVIRSSPAFLAVNLARGPPNPALLTTLLIYSTLNPVTRFAHSLGLKMKANKVTSLFLAVEQETGKEMLKSLSTVADSLIRFSKEKEGEKTIE